MILLTNKDGPTMTQFWFFKNIILIYQYARCNDVETINRKKHHKRCPLKLLLQYWNSGIKMFLLRHTALTHHFSHKLFHIYIYDNLLASGAPRRQVAYWIVHSIPKKQITSSLTGILGLSADRSIITTFRYGHICEKTFSFVAVHSIYY